jgi:23S rRNA U2552 (ribose-2'-O)-methylase RlmE/FtsJ
MLKSFFKKIKNYIYYRISNSPSISEFKYNNRNSVEDDIRNKYDYDGELLKFFTSNKKYTVHKWHHYLKLYDNHFSIFRNYNESVKILEIGVKKGGSLKLWRKFFGKKAIIFGIDINPECSKLNFKTEHVRIGNQMDENFLKSVVKEMGGIDIVIDDGSHRMDHIKAAFKCLFPLLNNKGVYAIEDLHTAYWPEFQGGYNSKDNFFNLVRELIDDMHNHYSKKKCKHSFIKKKLSGIHIYDSIVFMNKSKFYLPVHSKKN